MTQVIAPLPKAFQQGITPKTALVLMNKIAQSPLQK
jgi:hypothetical protein